MSLARLKKLIISPHVDDEVLGCSGILDKNSFVYYCGIDESKVAPDPKHRIPLKDRLKELRKTAEFLGFEYEVNKKSKVNFYVIQDVIKELERIINKTKPNIIFLPHSGYNQDHRTVFEAAQVALRPHDKNFFVKKVVTYEAIHDFLWSHLKFHPTLFIPIDIDRKIDVYKMQPSQVRGMRSPESLQKLASMRGLQAQIPYAEAFTIQRWVI